MINLLFFIWGCCWGSFFYCSHWRLKQKIPFSVKRSFCENCGHLLSWYELIPLLSFCLQKASCRHCQKKISPTSTFCELIFGLLFFYLSWSYPLPKLEFIMLLICWSTWLALEDWHTMTVGAPILFLGNLFFLCASFYLKTFKPDDLILVLILTLILSLFWLKSWLGSADLIFLVTCYYLMGLEKILLLLLISSILGIFWCLICQQKKIPFLPSLTVSLITIFIIS